jgi:hypothetical protein
MGLIRFMQAHNRNKELKNTRQLKEQELDILEHKELNEVRKTSEAEDEAPNILRSRYAKGEITKEQYERKKKDLE